MNKIQWNEPELLTLGANKTTDPIDPTDLGHGYDHYIHDHHCTCGLKFDKWDEAMTHEREMTEAGQSSKHNIGCDIFGIIS